MYCDVLPPRNMKLPVLPYRANEKLTFPLCKTCVESQQNAKCEHTDGQRILTAVWCTPEIHAAIDHGYQVKRIHEVWHYPLKQGRLFAEYIDTFLKIKQQASGWPEGVESDEQKDVYIDEFFQKEGILLDKENVVFNAGLRALAKLCLNRWIFFELVLGETCP